MSNTPHSRRFPILTAALSVLLVALGTACNEDGPTEIDSAAVAGEPSAAATATVTRVVLTPTDTLVVGPVGASGFTLKGTAYDANGKPIPGVQLKFWEDASFFSLDGGEYCTTASDGSCAKAVKTTGTGTRKVILKRYGGTSTHTRDTVWVRVQSSAPAEVPGDDPEPTPPDSTPGESTPLPAPSDGTCPASGYTRLVPVSSTSQLASALSNARPGDQIRVAAGTYGGVRLTSDGTANAPITICAAGDVTFRGGQFRIAGDHVVVSGFRFIGPIDESTPLVAIVGAGYVTFTRNEVAYGISHGALNLDDIHHITLTYNYVHHNGNDTSIDHGIYWKTTLGPGNVIAGNVITDNSARGISLHDNSGSGVKDVLVTNNTVVNNGARGILVGNGPNDRIIIANNIVAFNSHTNSGTQIRVEEGDNNQIRNNLTWSPTSSRAGIYNETSSPVTGNVIGNPRFVSQFSDLRLQSGSPAIGLALQEYVPRVDYAGKALDGDPDAGAYEY